MNIRHLSAWAAALALAMVSAAPLAHAEDKAPVNLRAVGGANLGGTWNVGLAGLGKLVNDRYPGSTFNVLQGASTSNPLRLDSNGGDITVTQGFNTFAAKTGMAPYKKPLTNIASLANINDISRFQIIVSRDLPVNSFDELVEKKIPVKMDRGATGTLANVLGGMLLAEHGASYDDVKKWGGKLTAVSQQRSRGPDAGRHHQRGAEGRPRRTESDSGNGAQRRRQVAARLRKGAEGRGGKDRPSRSGRCPEPSITARWGRISPAWWTPAS